MTKSEFVEMVQKCGEFKTKALAEKAVNAFTEAVTEALKNKESVQLVGFGSFTVKEVAEKTGKIPGSDKEYTKPAHTVVKFKAGKKLKAIN